MRDPAGRANGIDLTARFSASTVPARGGSRP